MPDVNEIPGWFDWHDLYSRMVSLAPDNAIFVEVGVFMGKSFCYLLQESRRRGKNFQIHAVDTFTGGEREQDEIVERLGGPDELYQAFIKNVRAQRYTGVRIHKQPSVEAAKMFKDGSIYFVFLDDAHDYKSVAADLEAWLPKIAPSGTMAGHDYKTWSSVKRAVDERFNTIIVEGDCWVVPRPNDHLDKTV
jgi:hypothetical protein